MKKNDYILYDAENYLSDDIKQKIILQTAEDSFVIQLNKIIRCVADKSYTNFYLTDGEKLCVSKNLQEFENMLSDHCFIRPHRSHLVNVAHILSIRKGDGGFIIMSDKSVVPISYRRKKNILSKINEYFIHC